ncbi:hypothetical protein PG996_007113 [Apiospora saccharicola]|uniref:Uncharacterized protein n=1 Tax=Apiospora saccharicola TaxID=335842 RepID=A0ABR1VCD7_9PEZI
MVLLESLRRSPKGGGGGGGHGGSSGGGKGSSSSSNTKGGGVVVVGGGGGGNQHHGDGGSHLPWWAIFLIVYFTIFTLLFTIALIYYCRKERKNQREGKSFRPWHAMWKAFCVASGLWIFIWLFKLLLEVVKKKRGSGSRQSGHNGPVSRAGGGAYTKVDEGDGSHDNTNIAYNSAGLTSWPANIPRVFGGSNSTSKYKSMGYSGATYVPPPPPPLRIITHQSYPLVRRFSSRLSRVTSSKPEPSRSYRVAVPARPRAAS